MTYRLHRLEYDDDHQVIGDQALPEVYATWAVAYDASLPLMARLQCDLLPLAFGAQVAIDQEIARRAAAAHLDVNADADPLPEPADDEIAY